MALTSSTRAEHEQRAVIRRIELNMSKELLFEVQRLYLTLRVVQTKNDAVRFLLEVKCAFGDDEEKYTEFLHLMTSFGENGIGKDEVIWRVKKMFYWQPKLVLGFNSFLPKGKKIHIGDE